MKGTEVEEDDWVSKSCFALADIFRTGIYGCKKNPLKWKQAYEKDLYHYEKNAHVLNKKRKMEGRTSVFLSLKIAKRLSTQT